MILKWQRCMTGGINLRKYCVALQPKPIRLCNAGLSAKRVRKDTPRLSVGELVNACGTTAAIRCSAGI